MNIKRMILLITSAGLITIGTLFAQDDTKAREKLKEEAAKLRVETLELEKKLIEKQIREKRGERFRKGVAEWYDHHSFVFGFPVGYQYQYESHKYGTSVQEHFVATGFTYYVLLEKRFLIGSKSTTFLSTKVYENDVRGEYGGIMLGYALDFGPLQLIPTAQIGGGHYYFANVDSEIPCFTAEAAAFVDLAITRNFSLGVNPYYVYSFDAPLEGAGVNLVFKVVDIFSPED